MTTVRIRTKDGLGFRGFELGELCPSGHSETEPKRAAAIRPSRKRVAQRDCFQSATDFSERVLQSARSKAKCSSRASTACSSAREGALATQQKTAPSSV